MGSHLQDRLTHTHTHTHTHTKLSIVEVIEKKKQKTAYSLVGFSLKVRNKAKMPSYSTSTQIWKEGSVINSLDETGGHFAN